MAPSIAAVSANSHQSHFVKVTVYRTCSCYFSPKPSHKRHRAQESYLLNSHSVLNLMPPANLVNSVVHRRTPSFDVKCPCANFHLKLLLCLPFPWNEGARAGPILRTTVQPLKYDMNVVFFADDITITCTLTQTCIQTANSYVQTYLDHAWTVICFSYLSFKRYLEVLYQSLCSFNAS